MLEEVLNQILSLITQGTERLWRNLLLAPLLWPMPSCERTGPVFGKGINPFYCDLRRTWTLGEGKDVGPLWDT